MGNEIDFDERWILQIRSVAGFGRIPPIKARRQTLGKTAISISELPKLVNADV